MQPGMSLTPTAASIFSISLAFLSHITVANAEMGGPLSRDVIFIYFVPSDRPVSEACSGKIAFVAKHFQMGLRQKLGGHIFRTSNPGVRIVRSDNPAKCFNLVK